MPLKQFLHYIILCNLYFHPVVEDQGFDFEEVISDKESAIIQKQVIIYYSRA